MLSAETYSSPSSTDAETSGSQQLSTAATSPIVPINSSPDSSQRTPPLRRYPTTLSNGRPYRRNHSTKFETFEELLREAGYKETRVCTPETDRINNREAVDQAQFDGDGQSAWASGFSYKKFPSRVAEFLTKLVAPKDIPAFKNNRHSRSLDANDPALPPSPLANRSAPYQPSKSNLNAIPSSDSRSTVEYSRATPRSLSSTENIVQSPSAATTASTITARQDAPYPKSRAQLRQTMSSPHFRRERHHPKIGVNLAPKTRGKRAPLPDPWLFQATKTAIENNSNISGQNKATTASQSITRKRDLSKGRGNSRPVIHCNVRRSPGTSERGRTFTTPRFLLARSHEYTSAPAVMSTIKVVCRSSSVGAGVKNKAPLLTSRKEGDILWENEETNAPYTGPERHSLTRTATWTSSLGISAGKLVPRLSGGTGSISASSLSVKTFDADESDDEPSLGNIFLPVARQRSIRSLRACLDRDGSARATGIMEVPVGIERRRPHPLRTESSLSGGRREAGEFAEDEYEESQCSMPVRGFGLNIAGVKWNSLGTRSKPKDQQQERERLLWGVGGWDE